MGKLQIIITKNTAVLLNKGKEKYAKIIIQNISKVHSKIGQCVL